MSSLQQDIDQRRQNIPQTYREALHHAEIFHEITRLYDVCLNSKIFTNEYFHLF
jgi:hypothetical protein